MEARLITIDSQLCRHLIRDIINIIREYDQEYCVSCKIILFHEMFYCHFCSNYFHSLCYNLHVGLAYSDSKIRLTYFQTAYNLTTCLLNPSGPKCISCHRADCICANYSIEVHLLEDSVIDEDNAWMLETGFLDEA